MQEDLGNRIYLQQFVSMRIKDAKEFFQSLFTQKTKELKEHEFQVIVTKDPNTKLLVEIAENTRKSASRMQEILLILQSQKNTPLPKEK